MTELGIIIDILLLIILFFAYLFYYKSLKYWKKIDFLDALGWGILSLPKKYKSLPKPGRTYGFRSMILYGIFCLSMLLMVLIGIFKLIIDAMFANS